MNLVGRTVGPYRLEAPLGKGGMAAVYRAYQSSVRRYVAIKVMAQEIANEPGFIERFEREAQIIASIEHPHILPVIDFGVADNIHYIVMRFMDGGSLDDLMRQRRLTLPEVAMFLTQISSALDHAHKKGIVHRDLKPNNVLLDKENNCYLTDFGIARMEGSDRRLTATGSVMGTPSYMSPEQAMGRPVDARSDIYTLGVMLYEMALGVLPFTADTPAALIFQHVYETPKPPKQVDINIPDTVAAVIDRALAKNPDGRYQTAGELANAFNVALNGPATGSVPKSPTGDFPSERTFVPGQSSNATLRPVTPAAGQTPAAWGQPPQTGAPTYMQPHIQSPMGTAATVAAPASGRKFPMAILVGGLLVIVLAIAAVALIANNNSQATLAGQTQTQVAEAQTKVAQTQTQVAIVLSYTKTPSPTSTPTNTPTSTATNTPTVTPSFTSTVDVTGTAFSIRATQIEQTAAALAAIQMTSTAAANLTSTAAVNQTATASALAKTALSQTQTRAAITPTPRINLAATANARLTLTAAARGGSPTVVPTKAGSVPTPNQAPDTALISDNGDTVLSALQAKGLVSTSGRIYRVPVDDPAPFLTGRTDQENIFYVSRFSRARFYDFAFSVDVAISSSDKSLEKTACGILYNGSKEIYDTKPALADMDMMVVYFYRNGFYGLSVRSNQNWRTPAVTSGISTAVTATNTENNRLTVVVVNNQVTAFINGVQVLQQVEKTYDGGFLGYFMLRGVAGDTEKCQFSNINVWRINP